MSAAYEPNPPSRKTEDFPKTNTMPEGWVMEEIMNAYNDPGPANSRGTAADMQAGPVPVPTTGGYEPQAAAYTAPKTKGNGHNGASHAVD